jgi:hypothetical protein
VPVKTKRPSPLKKSLHRPCAREKRAAREIRSLLETVDFPFIESALALDTFDSINRKLGSRSLRHWNVDLDHRDGSKLHFVDALLAQCNNWLGCFTRNHGFFIYHNSDLVRYNCVPKKVTAKAR